MCILNTLYFNYYIMVMLFSVTKPLKGARDVISNHPHHDHKHFCTGTSVLAVYIYAEERGIPWYATTTRGKILRVTLLISGLLEVALAIIYAATA